jgi:hypothetical protein
MQRAAPELPIGIAFLEWNGVDAEGRPLSPTLDPAAACNYSQVERVLSDADDLFTERVG